MHSQETSALNCFLLENSLLCRRKEWHSLSLGRTGLTFFGNLAILWQQSYCNREIEGNRLSLSKLLFLHFHIILPKKPILFQHVTKLDFSLPCYLKYYATRLAYYFGNSQSSGNVSFNSIPSLISCSFVCYWKQDLFE